ncbi:MAG TPA: hypothetical protein VGR20_20640, partial [Acidimicrobiia bacterium]|nr:hypothetical protein [Acidimicrobiia bacterium]
FDSGNVAVDLTATPAVPAPPAGAGPDLEPAAGASPALPQFEGPAAARSFPAPSGGLSVDPFAYTSGQPAFAAASPGSDIPDPAVPSGSPADATLAAAPGPPDPVLRTRPAVGFWESVPAPTVLLVPITVGLAVLIGMVLGPVGRPSPVFRREGGLSRALARRSPGGSDAGLHPPTR